MGMAMEMVSIFQLNRLFRNSFCIRLWPPMIPIKRRTPPRILANVTLLRRYRIINPMITAIGMVISTVNRDQEASCIALIQANDKPASVRIRIKRTAKPARSEEHTSELQSRENIVCRLLLEKKKSTDSIDIQFVN